MTAPRAQEPLPCPFCGGKPDAYQFAELECKCGTPGCYASSAGYVTIEVWNRRAPSADTRRLNDTPLFVSMIAGDDGYVLALAENGAVYMAEPNSFRPEEWALCVRPPNIRAAIDAAMTQEGE